MAGMNSCPRIRWLVALVGITALCASVVLGQPLPLAKPEEVGMSSERLSRLDAAFEGYVAKGELAGAVALVARRGKVAHFEAYGLRDIESALPMREDTIFRIASQTKALVSVGIMILQEEGKLLIRDAVGKHLPEYDSTTVAVAREGGGYDVVPARRKITLRDLLTHTAGIDYGDGPAKEEWAAAGMQGWYFGHRDEPIRETVRRMAALPMAAQPGERYVYGYATDILGAVIEEVSGMTLDAFLEQRITGPLGMVDTHFYLPQEKRSRLSVVYGKSGNGPLARKPEESSMGGQGDYVDGFRRSFSGGAGLLSTASDYARFLQMLLNGGELEGKRILSRKSVELMTVDHLKGDARFVWNPGTGFGLGFSVVTDVGGRGELCSLGEYGWGGAYHSSYWVAPAEDLVVVYFTQVLPADGLDDHGKLRALVYQSLVD